MAGQDAVRTLSVYLGVQWWAYKYSDGGGKHIQRMLACRSEHHARGATVLFASVNYSIQVWPWIVTALCSLVVFEPLDDPEMGYPYMMAKVLPAGLLGLLVVTMLGAFMSTVDTHLNLGGAYVVNDIYKRFIRPDASERHYVLVSRLAMTGMLIAGIIVALSIDSIGDAWKFILAFASGAGLTWVMRWFWWRVNAWTEITAMLTSGAVAIVLQLTSSEMLYSWRLLLVVSISTAVWLPVTLLTPPTDEATLVDFVRRVRPGGPGWRDIYARHGIRPDPYLTGGLIDWLIGVVALFGANFGIGSFLLGDWVWGVVLSVVALAAGVLLAIRMRRDTRSASE